MGQAVKPRAWWREARRHQRGAGRAGGV